MQGTPCNNTITPLPLHALLSSGDCMACQKAKRKEEAASPVTFYLLLPFGCERRFRFRLFIRLQLTGLLAYLRGLAPDSWAFVALPRQLRLFVLAEITLGVFISFLVYIV